MQTAQGGGHRTLLYGHAILLRHSYSGMVSARVACSPPVVMLIRLCICGQEIFGNPISLMALTSLVVCFFFFLIIYLIYLFLAVFGLRFCARAFSSCGKWGPLFIAVRRPLTIMASLVGEHRLQTRRLSNGGSRA